jgi:glycosyltransferase involved in cell wall biosynthesis
MILLDALYINNSGGRVLLDYLVAELEKSDLDVFYLLDVRCQPDYDFIAEDKRIYLKASLLNRHRFYVKHHNTFSKVLCFANLPPSIRLPIPVYTYFHNVHYIHPKFLSFKVTVEMLIKKIILKALLNNADEFWVQTSHVANSFQKTFGFNKFRVLPFYDINFDSLSVEKKETTFVYVSEGNPHKNHKRLIKAWELVNKKYPNLELQLTVSSAREDIFEMIVNYENRGVQLVNHQQVSKKELKSIYENARYLIFPSLYESFGLGLIEAQLSGCTVIASDLPYVHSVLEPHAVFDPFSVQSIANTVIEFYKNSQGKVISTSKQSLQNQIQGIINYLSL